MTEIPRAARPRRGPVRRGLALGAQALAALLSLSVVCGSGWAWATYRNFQDHITHIDALPGAGPSGSNAANDGADLNIVLVGTDDRGNATPAQLAELNTTDDGGSLNTDTMLLLHVPSDGSRATLISFPRDSWVSIPGFGQDKLNAAYSYGSNGGADPDAGRRLLIEVIQNLTGLTVDHYVEIGLLGFYNITNALGGVTINLCEPQQDSYSGINLPAGVQKIQGSQALAFVRQRHGLDDYGGDLQRARRQQYFLSQVFKQVQSAGTLLNPIKIQNLLSAVSGSLAMDDPSFALPLAQQMANLSAGNTTMANIPITGFGVSSDGQDIVNVDYTAMPDFIAQVIGATDPKYAPAAQTAPANVTVDVLNGTGIDGLARANANALSAAGFAIGSVQDGPVTSSTIIRYPDGKQSQAKALAAEVPGALLSKNNTVGRVTLILGQNEVQVASLTPAAPTDSAPTDSPTANTTRSGADTSCIN